MRGGLLQVLDLLGAPGAHVTPHRSHLQCIVHPFSYIISESLCTVVWTVRLFYRVWGYFRPIDFLFLLLLGCVVKWTRGSSIRLVWFGSAQKVRCNSIKGSLRVALVISSLLIMNLYTGRSPMSIQVRTLSTGARFAGDDI